MYGYAMIRYCTFTFAKKILLHHYWQSGLVRAHCDTRAGKVPGVEANVSQTEGRVEAARIGSINTYLTAPIE